VSRVMAWKRARKLVEEGFLYQEGEKGQARYYPTDRLRAMLAQHS